MKYVYYKVYWNLEIMTSCTPKYSILKFDKKDQTLSWRKRENLNDVGVGDSNIDSIWVKTLWNGYYIKKDRTVKKIKKLTKDELFFEML